MSESSFRYLPSVDQAMRDASLELLSRQMPRVQVLGWVRQSVELCRANIAKGTEYDRDSALAFVVQHTLDASRFEYGRVQQSVINATGILLHTNLGRACLADHAIARMNQAVGYSNVEMNMLTGRRNKRGERVCELLGQLTGAESAVLVNNCAAATMLTLQTMAGGREVIISRGQLVEIGGGYRLPEVFAASGAVMKEVGTTNRTYLRDYEAVISENTAAIIRVHRSNFYQGGFVTEPTLDELVDLGGRFRVPVIDDIGSGCMKSLAGLGLAEPTIPESVAAGADVTLFSGDKLFGGPQAGMIVGKQFWIDKLRSSPMARALRIDKVTLAALEATVEIHLRDTTAEEIPLLAMLSATQQEIRDRCQSVASRLSVPDGFTVRAIECVSEIGGGSVPGSAVPSAALQIDTADVERFAELLRTGVTPIQGTIRDSAVRLDLRTVRVSEVDLLVDNLNAAFDRVGGKS